MLSTVDGFNHTPSEAMALGSMVHRLIATYLKGHRGDKLWPPYWSTRDCLRGVLEAMACEDQWYLPDTGADDKYLDGFLFEAGLIAKEWHQQVFEPSLRDVAVVAVEEEMRTVLTVKDGGIALVGTPDLVSPGTVFDWKVAGRGWSENKDGLTKGSFSPQPPLYLHLVRSAGLGIAPNKFVFFVYDRKKHEWTPFETEWSDIQIEAAVQNAKHAARMIIHDAWQFTPFSTVFGKTQRGWWCSRKYCGAWNICQGKRMISDDTDTEVEYDPRWVVSPEGEA